MNQPAYPVPRVFEGGQLDRVSFPIGGMGAGMFCLDGSGAFSHFSLRHLPDYFNEAWVFSAIAVRGEKGVTARVLEGPVAAWKPLFPWTRTWESSGHGGRGHGFGLPRFDSARFAARFPFAEVELREDALPLRAGITAWSPFIPGDADNSGLPAGAVEYTFTNTSAAPLELVYSFHAKNFLPRNPTPTNHAVKGIAGGFVLSADGTEEKPSEETSCAMWIDDPAAQTDLAWFRGGWFDSATVLWKNISEGRAQAQPAVTEGEPSPGGSIYLPLRLAPGEKRTVRLLLAWYSPYSTLREGQLPLPEGAKPDLKTDCYRPWYAARFSNITDVASYWTKECGRLREATANFTSAFYDSTLPPEVLDAIAANLTILKTPTVLREKGGRLWAWEGTGDDLGSCHGTCTHVWNYAQALPHLFPALERGLRETEFFDSQDERGHQNFRSALPLGPTPHDFHAAADGQLGGIVKVYRDWRISGDAAWLKKFWPRVRQSLDYCIEAWDPEHRGLLVEPHHNTYDIEFWGADGMCTSFYLAALNAAVAMGRAQGEDVSRYEKLLATGTEVFARELFNGEYFIQKVQWKGLRAKDPVAEVKVGIMMNYTTEARALLEKEGPKYQYGDGCLSDGILGEWMAWAAGLAPVADVKKIESHLTAVHRHNFRRDLSKHPNPQRPSYAFNREAGLLLCTWPRGGALTLPFVYSEEAWTGIEYHVAAHLISLGHVAEGLEIVRACRDRYEGAMRNPFGEIECGHWYARAMASYALLQAFTGAHYDAVEKKLYLAPRIAGDFRSFLAFDGGYGTVGVRKGEPFFETRSGTVEIREIVFTPHEG
jgi:uncharacterized protein (DUF608 family)